MKRKRIVKTATMEPVSRQSVEDFLANGGAVKVLPPGASSEELISETRTDLHSGLDLAVCRAFCRIEKRQKRKK